MEPILASILKAKIAVKTAMRAKSPKIQNQV
jgi:hypothetical protein